MTHILTLQALCNSYINVEDYPPQHILQSFKSHEDVHYSENADGSLLCHAVCPSQKSFFQNNLFQVLLDAVSSSYYTH